MVDEENGCNVVSNKGLLNFPFLWSILSMESIKTTMCFLLSDNEENKYGMHSTLPNSLGVYENS